MLLWQSAKNPTHTEWLLSAVENKVEKSSCTKRESSQVELSLTMQWKHGKLPPLPDMGCAGWIDWHKQTTSDVLSLVLSIKLQCGSYFYGESCQKSAFSVVKSTSSLCVSSIHMLWLKDMKGHVVAVATYLCFFLFTYVLSIFSSVYSQHLESWVRLMHVCFNPKQWNSFD